MGFISPYTFTGIYLITVIAIFLFGLVLKFSTIFLQFVKMRPQRESFSLNLREVKILHYTTDTNIMNTEPTLTEPQYGDVVHEKNVNHAVGL